MKDLPKVFANKINDSINNTQEIFYGGDREVHKNTHNINVRKKINDIFASRNHVYKSMVKIYLENKILEKEIVGKNNTFLITKEGELIKISDIQNIEKIN